MRRCNGSFSFLSPAVRRRPIRSALLQRRRRCNRDQAVVAAGPTASAATMCCQTHAPCCCFHHQLNSRLGCRLGKGASCRRPLCVRVGHERPFPPSSPSPRPHLFSLILASPSFLPLSRVAWKWRRWCSRPGRIPSLSHRSRRLRGLWTSSPRPVQPRRRTVRLLPSRQWLKPCLLFRPPIATPWQCPCEPQCLQLAVFAGGENTCPSGLISLATYLAIARRRPSVAKDPNTPTGVGALGCQHSS